MKNNTKTGLLLVMIGLVFGVISDIVLYFINFDVDDISEINNIYIAMAPALLFMIMGGLILLIGGILMITGREDYGEKHSKFVIYAIVIFVINFFITIMLKGISTAMEPTMYFSFVKPTLADYEPIILITVISSVISAILGGLIYVFLFFHLESYNGRILLFTAYAISVVVAIIVAIYSHAIFTKMIKDLLTSGTVDSSTVSQAISQLSNMSKAAIFGSISAMLFIWAAYIPYKRIKTGELKPVLPKHLKRCMNCGRVIPADSIVCAYCGNKISNYDYDNRIKY